MVIVLLLKGKSFEITYVRLKFHSSRPESFAIYRRMNESADWTPYQFYSSTCRETYNMPSERSVSRDDEARAICRDDFSDISPLSGASVAFSTLEGRPSAFNFDNSAQLQVRLTDRWTVGLCSSLTVNICRLLDNELSLEQHWPVPFPPFFLYDTHSSMTLQWNAE